MESKLLSNLVFYHLKDRPDISPCFSSFPGEKEEVDEKNLAESINKICKDFPAAASGLFKCYGKEEITEEDVVIDGIVPIANEDENEVAMNVFKCWSKISTFKVE
jgi:hypothetical protein